MQEDDDCLLEAGSGVPINTLDPNSQHQENPTPVLSIISESGEGKEKTVDELLHESQVLAQQGFASGERFDRNSEGYFDRLCKVILVMVQRGCSVLPGNERMALLYGIANLASSLVGTFGLNKEPKEGRKKNWFCKYCYNPKRNDSEKGKSIWRDLAYVTLFIICWRP